MKVQESHPRSLLAVFAHPDDEACGPADTLARYASKGVSEPVWLFDLDNTLYPSNSGLMEAISARIDQFIELKLNLPPAVAEAVRQAYYSYYGSSIGGMLRHCRVDAGELIDFVHDLPPDDYLSPDLRLTELLASLPGRKFVFTNAPAEYAWRALRALGVDRYFERVFDIYFGGLQGKPSLEVYEKVMAALGQPMEMCWLVDDAFANLLPAKALGCRTVWITPDGKAPPVYVDHTIRHLADLRDAIKQTSVQEEKSYS